MATECLKPFRGKVMRITKLNACGGFTAAAASVVTTKGFVSVAQTANYRDPDEYEVVNANGDLCMNERSDQQLKWLDLVITLCEVDVEALNLMTGSPLVLDEATPTPNNVGFRTREGTTAHFALELWTDLAGAACVGGAQKYGYMLLPWVRSGTLGDVTIENAAASFTINARTSAGSQWGVGPYNIRNTVGETPAPAKLLTAIQATDHRHMQVVDIAPPTPACGATALVVA
jgi:hypothetical protein